MVSAGRGVDGVAGVAAEVDAKRIGFECGCGGVLRFRMSLELRVDDVNDWELGVLKVLHCRLVGTSDSVAITPWTLD